MKIANKYDLVNLTLCEKIDKFHSLQCIDRQCEKCGVHQLASKLDVLTQEHGAVDMTWMVWETTKSTIMVNGVSKLCTRKANVRKNGTLGSFVRELTEDTQKLAKHLFVASWQQQAYSQLTKSIPDNTTVVVLDFAQNYTCINQDEIQSAHWTNNQVTVHPIVSFYNCPDCTNTHPVQEAMVFLSDDLTHDCHAVAMFVKIANQHLLKERKITMGKQIQFSDGCSSQYKSRMPFCDISYSEVDFGFKIERHYFGSQHGKGPCDGVAGTVKAAVRQAVVSRQAVVTNANEMFQYCHRYLTRDDGECTKYRRRFFFIPRGSIERNRPTRVVKKFVKGTQQLHGVRCVRPGVIDVRKLSCFCISCATEDGSNCLNTAHVDSWKTVQMHVNDIPNADVCVSHDSCEALHTETHCLHSTENNSDSEAVDQHQSKNGTTDCDVSACCDGRVTESGVSDPKTDNIQCSGDIQTLPGHRRVNQDQLGPGVFVAVKLVTSYRKHTVYIAQVQNVSDNNLELKYLKLKKPGSDVYVWPENEDISWEPIQVVISVVTMSLRHGRQLQFSLSPEDSMTLTLLAEKQKYKLC
ncbi:uncharacterized protein [Ptychodera flava]|uniref:uncharacterized protein n=1 Tax=Ptychodera flava TaxID=63121 RepID=UPI003969E8B6